MAQLQRSFWDLAERGGPKLDQTGFFPTCRSRRRDHSHHRQFPQQDISRYYVTLVSSMRTRSNGLVDDAYFWRPSEELTR